MWTDLLLMAAFVVAFAWAIVAVMGKIFDSVMGGDDADQSL